MKNLINRLLILSVASLVLFSCEKDEVRAVLQPGSTPTLSTTQNTLVLQQANASQEALKFLWAPVQFGFDAAVTYTLQISKAGTNFAPASTTNIPLSNFSSSSTSSVRTFTVGELNSELLKIVSGGSAQQVEVRLVASPSPNVAPVYSNTLTLTVTPYRDLVSYSFPQALNVAGNFQGWNPGAAPQLVGTDGKYSGFIEFNNATPEFKLVKGNAWSAGDFGGGAGTGGTGTLTNGGSNLSLPDGAGTYYVTANTNSSGTGAMTWTYYKINTWGVIGSATAGGWNSDQDMTYNATTKTWSVTLNLSVGEFKFRANDDWAVNLGDNGNDGKPEINGANIPITVAGNYTITLDVSVGGNWFYTVKKN